MIARLFSGVVVIAVGATAVAAAAPPAARVQRAQMAWTMRDLGTLPGHVESEALALNGGGEVLGNSYPLGRFRPSRAFVWRAGRIVDLGTLGGESSWATAINNRGQVVGSSQTRGGWRHAFVWENGRMRDLGTLPGMLVSEAVAINERGDIVGSSSSRTTRRAVLWRDGRIVSLDAGSSAATGVNERGEVVGWTRWRTNADGRRVRDRRWAGNAFVWQAQHAFVWRNGRIQNLPAAPARPFAVARAINDGGQIIGWARPLEEALSEGQRAVLWDRGRLIVLRRLPGRPDSGLADTYADDLNERGQIVGNGVAGQRRPPLLWDDRPGATVEVLPGLGGTGGSATSINERGQIAGISWRNDRSVHAVVWESGRITDLGALQLGNVVAINERGMIAGTSMIGRSRERHAVLWAPR